MHKNSLFLVVAVWALSGCGALKTRDHVEPAPPKPPAVEPDKPVTAQRPPVSEALEPNQQHAVETPLPSVKMPKVGLILGPGGAKAFAHTGVIRELNQARVPIHAVVGMEWGALVAALYAQRGQIHETEWRLYKLEQKDFLERGLFSSDIQPDSVKKLSPFLISSFGAQKMEANRIPFACPSLSVLSGTLVWQKQGTVQDAVEKCLPYPPLFKATSPFMAAAFALEEAARHLRSQGAELVIFVNVLDGGEILKQGELIEKYESAILWMEARRHLKSGSTQVNEVIEVETRAFPIYDFDSRKKLVLAGEVAGRRLARKIADKYGF